MSYYLIYDPSNGKLIGQTEGPDPTARVSLSGYVTIVLETEPNWRTEVWDEATLAMVPRPVAPPPPPATREMDQHSLFATAASNWENLGAATQASILRLVIEATP